MRESPVRVLIVTDKPEPTARLREALRLRGADRDVQFRLIVLNPARAELHLFHPERRDLAAEAEITLRAALPQLEHAARGPVIGTVSIRHDPMDAIEEVLLGEPVDWILLDVEQHRLTLRLRQDLEDRLAHYRVPVTTIRQDAPNGLGSVARAGRRPPDSSRPAESRVTLALATRDLDGP